MPQKPRKASETPIQIPFPGFDAAAGALKARSLELMMDGAQKTISVHDRLSAFSRLRSAQKQHLLQIAPGIFRTANEVQPPDLILARLVSKGDGTFELIPAYENWVRVCSRVAKVLGFDGQINTIYRLGRAGFIELALVAPKCTLLNLASWFSHLGRVVENPEFWDESTKSGKERLQHYRKFMF